MYLQMSVSHYTTNKVNGVDSSHYMPPMAHVAKTSNKNIGSDHSMTLLLGTWARDNLSDSAYTKSPGASKYISICAIGGHTSPLDCHYGNRHK